MNANPFIDTFDAAAFDAFADSGLANLATYKATPADTPVDRRAMLDSGLQTQGEYQQILSRRTLITFWLADGALVKGSSAVMGGKTYLLHEIDPEDSGDGSLQRWVVRNG